jgi:hypothetical protein
MLILRELWEHQPRSLYPDVIVPVLLLPVDTGDPRWTKAKSQSIDVAVKELARCRVHWLKGDHDIHAQHPEELADVLHGAVRGGLFA